MMSIKRGELSPRPEGVGGFFYKLENGNYAIKSVEGECVLTETEAILEYTKSALESLIEHAKEKRECGDNYVIDSVGMDYETTNEKHILKFTMLGHVNDN